LHVVGMMMGHEDVGKRPAFFAERGKDRFGFWRIDRRRRAALGRMHKDTEIVGEAWELADLEAHAVVQIWALIKDGIVWLDLRSAARIPFHSHRLTGNQTSCQR
jgi:hypothetical protein